jgi:hypothetical protein
MHRSESAQDFLQDDKTTDKELCESAAIRPERD